LVRVHRPHFYNCTDMSSIKSGSHDIAESDDERQESKQANTYIINSKHQRR